MAITRQERDIPKSDARVFAGSNAMILGFIEPHRGEFSVSHLCEVLGISSSGFYAWRERKPGKREQANDHLVEHIRAVHDHAKRRVLI